MGTRTVENSANSGERSGGRTGIPVIRYGKQVPVWRHRLEYQLGGRFNAPEALDPHGILLLQIALSDRLFPGMSTQHTRTRYVLFCGWHLDRLAADRAAPGGSGLV